MSKRKGKDGMSNGERTAMILEQLSDLKASFEKNRSATSGKIDELSKSITQIEISLGKATAEGNVYKYLVPVIISAVMGMLAIYINYTVLQGPVGKKLGEMETIVTKVKDSNSGIESKVTAIETKIAALQDGKFSEKIARLEGRVDHINSETKAHVASDGHQNLVIKYERLKSEVENHHKRRR